VHLPLLADGRLRIECDPALAPLLERWLPLLPYEPVDPPGGGAVIRIVAGDPACVALAAGAAALRLGTAEARVDAAAGRASLHAPFCAAGVDLAALQAELVVRAGVDDEAAAWDLYGLCTLLCAMLLGRLGRALVHAAAIVAPDGRAWLLAGDARAGKSTTAVNLISAGWRFVSDDNGVLFRGMDGAPWVEGWPRLFHLDEGWEAGAPLHRRGEVDPHARWPGQWVRTAPLAGLLFPRVEADRPTELAPLPAAEALAALMRQSPWLLADRACAAEVLSFLREACERPAFSLRLGLDSYRDTARLLDVLAPLTG
jgi:hypothetical protein